MDGALYRVTADVDASIAAEWLAWMRDVHVPDVLREAGFVRATVYRDTAPSAGGARFVVDYLVESRAALTAYLGGDAVKRLRAEHEARFGGRARASREVLEPVASVNAERPGTGAIY